MGKEDLEKIIAYLKRFPRKCYWYALSFLITLFILSNSVLKVVSFSMEPTLMQGDVVVIDRISLFFFNPRRGALIVYRDPRQEEKPYVIKRVVGMPNELFLIREGIISVVDESGATTTFPIGSFLGRDLNGKDFQIKLGPLDYLLLGDNRSGSRDGRATGSIQPSEMTGRAYFRIWPLSRFGILD